MIHNLNLNKLLWFLVAIMSLIAALAGVFRPGIYGSVAAAAVLPGVISQDIISIIAASVILLLLVRIREEDVTRQVIILGLLGYYFYAYGIYVLERFYNVFYFLYMAIFALSFYGIVYFVSSIRREILSQVKVPKLIRNIAVGFSLFIPALFYPLWISQLLPLIQEGRKIEFMYSVFILDMCFIFPAFIIIAISAARKRGFGLLLLPISFVNGFTLLFSVALGGVLRPFFQQTWNRGEVFLYLAISILFLALIVLYFRNLKINKEHA